MDVLRPRNVHEAYPLALHHLEAVGIPEESRNGTCFVNPAPLTTVFTYPTERVVFWSERDANPFFHLMEALWMLAGRKDLKWLLPFNARMKDYSEDGRTLPASYGWRWRKHFKQNQISSVIELLRNSPKTRRAVLVMYDPITDQHTDEKAKDVPCNTSIYLWRRAGELNMTVACRSNDMVWGAYGANAVHFSILQEYIAGMIKEQVGRLYLVSNNFHAYEQTVSPLWDIRSMGNWSKSPYREGHVKAMPLVEWPKWFELDLEMFMKKPLTYGFRNGFFSLIAKPMYFAHVAWRDRKDPDRYDKALEIVSQMPEDNDWRLAATEWLLRRKEKWEKS